MLGNVFNADPALEHTLRGTYNGDWAGGEEPGAFTGALSAPFKGIKHAADVAASALSEAATPVIEEFAPEVVSGWFRDQRRVAYQSMAETRPDPATMGLVGQIGHALGSVMTMGAMGAVAAPVTGLSSLGVAAYAIGGLSGYDKYHELRGQGIGESEALKAAGITGVTMGAGAALPPFVGGTLARQIASGIGINVGLGFAERGGISTILQEKYPQVAEHYKVLDGSAMMIDAVLGAAFPLGARMLPKGADNQPTVGELDTALHANRGVAEQTRDPALQATLEGIDRKLAADMEVTRQIVEEGRALGAVEVPRGIMDDTVPNVEVGRQAALVARAIDDLMVQESGRGIADIEADIATLTRAFNPERVEPDAPTAKAPDDTAQKAEAKALEETTIMYDTGRGEKPITAKAAIEHIDKTVAHYADFIKCIGG